MALVVVGAVATALARAEPCHRWDALGIAAAGRVQHRARHRAPFRAALGAGDAPAIGCEPLCRRSVHDGTDGHVIDAVVVPVNQEDQVVQAQAPGAVARLVAGPWRQTALALDREDLHVARARQAQRCGLARGRRHAVPGRSGVELEEEGLALHLGVPGQSATVAEGEQVLPGQRPATGIGEGEALVAIALVARPQRLVEHRKGGVHQRNGVARRKHETVGEWQPRTADIPAHGSRQQQCQEDVHLRARATGMPGLTVVEGEVDCLVDDLPDQLPVIKGAFGRLVQGVGVARPLPYGGHWRTDAAPTTVPVRSSRASDSPMRSSAADRFSRELA